MIALIRNSPGDPQPTYHDTPIFSGDLWEPDIDLAEWPELRDYVSPAELDAYAGLLCASDMSCDSATGVKAIGSFELPPPPPRRTLTLNDLATAEAVREDPRRDSFPTGIWRQRSRFLVHGEPVLLTLSRDHAPKAASPQLYCELFSPKGKQTLFTGDQKELLVDHPGTS